MGSGGGSGKNIFFVGETRVPQVYVHVHQARADHKAGGVDDLVRLLPDVLLQLDDLPVFDIQVLHGDGAVHRVHHASMFDQQFHSAESSNG